MCTFKNLEEIWQTYKKKSGNPAFLFFNLAQSISYN